MDEDAAYDKKLKELQEYLPFLDSMNSRLQLPSYDRLDNISRTEHLAKIKSLKSLLIDKGRRMKMHNLLKCESVLIKLSQKFEKAKGAGSPVPSISTADDLINPPPVLTSDTVLSVPNIVKPIVAMNFYKEHVDPGAEKTEGTSNLALAIDISSDPARGVSSELDICRMKLNSVVKMCVQPRVIKSTPNFENVLQTHDNVKGESHFSIGIQNSSTSPGCETAKSTKDVISNKVESLYTRRPINPHSQQPTLEKNRDIPDRSPRKYASQRKVNYTRVLRSPSKDVRLESPKDRNFLESASGKSFSPRKATSRDRFFKCSYKSPDRNRRANEKLSRNYKRSPSPHNSRKYKDLMNVNKDLKKDFYKKYQDEFKRKSLRSSSPKHSKNRHAKELDSVYEKTGRNTRDCDQFKDASKVIESFEILILSKIRKNLKQELQEVIKYDDITDSSNCSESDVVRKSIKKDKTEKEDGEICESDEEEEEEKCIKMVYSDIDKDTKSISKNIDSKSSQMSMTATLPQRATDNANCEEINIQDLVSKSLEQYKMLKASTASKSISSIDNPPIAAVKRHDVKIGSEEIVKDDSIKLNLLHSKNTTHVEPTKKEKSEDATLESIPAQSGTEIIPDPVVPPSSFEQDILQALNNEIKETEIESSLFTVSKTTESSKRLIKKTCPIEIENASRKNDQKSRRISLETYKEKINSVSHVTSQLAGESAQSADMTKKYEEHKRFVSSVLTPKERERFTSILDTTVEDTIDDFENIPLVQDIDHRIRPPNISTENLTSYIGPESPDSNSSFLYDRPSSPIERNSIYEPPATTSAAKILTKQLSTFKVNENETLLSLRTDDVNVPPWATPTHRTYDIVHTKNNVYASVPRLPGDSVGPNRNDCKQEIVHPVISALPKPSMLTFDVFGKVIESFTAPDAKHGGRTPMREDIPCSPNPFNMSSERINSPNPNANFRFPSPMPYFQHRTNKQEFLNHHQDTGTNIPNPIIAPHIENSFHDIDSRFGGESPRYGFSQSFPVSMSPMLNSGSDMSSPHNVVNTKSFTSNNVPSMLRSNYLNPMSRDGLNSPVYGDMLSDGSASPAPMFVRNPRERNLPGPFQLSSSTTRSDAVQPGQREYVCSNQFGMNYNAMDRERYLQEGLNQEVRFNRIIAGQNQKRLLNERGMVNHEPSFGPSLIPNNKLEIPEKFPSRDAVMDVVPDRMVRGRSQGRVFNREPSVGRSLNMDPVRDISFEPNVTRTLVLDVDRRNLGKTFNCEPFIRQISDPDSDRLNQTYSQAGGFTRECSMERTRVQDVDNRINQGPNRSRGRSVNREPSMGQDFYLENIPNRMNRGQSQGRTFTREPSVGRTRLLEDDSDRMSRGRSQGRMLTRESSVGRSLNAESDHDRFSRGQSQGRTFNHERTIMRPHHFDSDRDLFVDHSWNNEIRNSSLDNPQSFSHSYGGRNTSGLLESRQDGYFGQNRNSFGPRQFCDDVYSEQIMSCDSGYGDVDQRMTIQGSVGNNFRQIHANIQLSETSIHRSELHQGRLRQTVDGFPSNMAKQNPKDPRNRSTDAKVDNHGRKNRNEYGDNSYKNKLSDSEGSDKKISEKQQVCRVSNDTRIRKNKKSRRGKRLIDDKYSWHKPSEPSKISDPKTTSNASARSFSSSRCSSQSIKYKIPKIKRPFVEAKDKEVKQIISVSKVSSTNGLASKKSPSVQGDSLMQKELECTKDVQDVVLIVSDDAKMEDEVICLNTDEKKESKPDRDADLKNAGDTTNAIESVINDENIDEDIMKLVPVADDENCIDSTEQNILKKPDTTSENIQKQIEVDSCNHVSSSDTPPEVESNKCDEISNEIPSSSQTKSDDVKSLNENVVSSLANIFKDRSTMLAMLDLLKSKSVNETEKLEEMFEKITKLNKETDASEIVIDQGIVEQSSDAEKNITPEISGILESSKAIDSEQNLSLKDDLSSNNSKEDSTTIAVQDLDVKTLKANRRRAIGNRELFMLQEDLREMFISQGVMDAENLGFRMCRLTSESASVKSNTETAKRKRKLSVLENTESPKSKKVSPRSKRVCKNKGRSGDLTPKLNEKSFPQVHLEELKTNDHPKTNLEVYDYDERNEEVDIFKTFTSNEKSTKSSISGTTEKNAIVSPLKKKRPGNRLLKKTKKKGVVRKSPNDSETVENLSSVNKINSSQFGDEKCSSVDNPDSEVNVPVKTTDGADSTKKAKNSVLKKKKRGGWSTGVIKKKRSTKIKQTSPIVSPVPPVVTNNPEPTPDEPFDIKSYHFISSASKYSCVICQKFHGLDIVGHFKTVHPHSEVIISRLHPVFAKLAVDESHGKTGDENRIVDVSKFQCRFCERLFINVTPKTFYSHITRSHTGEYKAKCNICSSESGKSKMIHECNNFSILPPDLTSSEVFGYICGLCNYTQVNEDNVKNHLSAKHFDEECKIIKINLSNHIFDAPDTLNDDDDESRNNIVTASKISTPEVDSKTSPVKKKTITKKQETASKKTASDYSINITSQPFVVLEKTLPIESESLPKESQIESDSILEDTTEESLNELKYNDETHTLMQIKQEILTTYEYSAIEEVFSEDIVMKKEPSESSPKMPSTSREHAHTESVDTGDLQIFKSMDGSVRYVCSIETCKFETKFFLIFAKHIKFDHMHDEWDGFCKECGFQTIKEEYSTYLDALDHILAHLNADSGKPASASDTNNSVIEKASENLTSKIQIRPLSDLLAKKPNTADMASVVPHSSKCDPVPPTDCALSQLCIENVVSLHPDSPSTPSESQVPQKSIADLVLKYTPSTQSKLTNVVISKQTSGDAYSKPQEKVSPEETCPTEPQCSSECDRFFKCAIDDCFFSCQSPTLFAKHTDRHCEELHSSTGQLHDCLCYDCDFVAKSGYELVAHIEELHFANSMFDENSCEGMLAMTAASCSSPVNLEETGRGKIDGMLPKTSVFPRYKCTAKTDDGKCQETFLSSQLFLDHVKSAHKIRKLRCHECSSSPISFWTLIYHLRLCHGYCLYSCVFCGVGFDIEASAQGHLSSEHPDKRQLLYMRSVEIQKTKRTEQVILIDIDPKSIAKSLASKKLSEKFGKTMMAALTKIPQAVRSVPNLYPIVRKSSTETGQLNSIPTIDTTVTNDSTETSLSPYLATLPKIAPLPKVSQLSKTASSNNTSSTKATQPQKINPSSNNITASKGTLLSEIILTPATEDSRKGVNVCLKEKENSNCDSVVRPSVQNENDSTVISLDSDEEDNVPLAFTQIKKTALNKNINEISKDKSSDTKEIKLKTPTFSKQPPDVIELLSDEEVSPAKKKESNPKTVMPVNISEALETPQISENKSVESKHIGLVSKDLYRCGNHLCKFRSATSSEYKDHLTICDYAKEHSKLPCFHCNRRFKSNMSLLDHIHTHGIVRYTCGICEDFKSSSMISVNGHMYKIHKITSAVAVPCDPLKRNVDTDQFIMKPSEKIKKRNQKRGKVQQKSMQTVSPVPTPPALPVSSKKLSFDPDEVNELPLTPVFSEEVLCKKCTYSTKVRSNMIRHLFLHSNEISVPSAAPVNPVPTSGPKHFDTMSNLALSSNLDKQPVLKISTERQERLKLGTTVNKLQNIPVYIPKKERFVCGAKGCSYISVDERMLRHHWEALHCEETVFKCAHCSQEIWAETGRPLTTGDIGDHLVLHKGTLYQCESCTFLHPQIKGIERHANEGNCSGGPPKLLRERRPWKCKMCSTRTVLKNEIVQHCKQMHNVLNQFKCSLCLYYNASKDCFSDHIKKYHSGRIVDVVSMYSKGEDPFDVSPIWWKQRKQGSGFVNEVADRPPSPVAKKMRIESPKMNPIEETEPPVPRTIHYIINNLEEIDTDIDVKPTLQALRIPSTLPEPMQAKSARAEPTARASLKYPGQYQQMTLLVALPNKEFQCTMCSEYVTESVSGMRTHLYEELNYRKWCCEVCNYKSFDKESIIDHCLQAHRIKRVKELLPDLSFEDWVEKNLRSMKEGIMDVPTDNVTVKPDVGSTKIPPTVEEVHEPVSTFQDVRSHTDKSILNAYSPGNPGKNKLLLSDNTQEVQLRIVEDTERHDASMKPADNCFEAPNKKISRKRTPQKNLFGCGYCNFKTSRKPYVQRHHRNRHEGLESRVLYLEDSAPISASPDIAPPQVGVRHDKNFMCLVCEKSVVQAEIDQHHKSCHPNETNQVLEKKIIVYKCQLCMQLTADLPLMMNHFEKFHPDDDKNYVMHKLGSPKFKRIFAQKDTTVNVELNSKFHCRYCRVVLLSFTSLLEHHQLNHYNELLGIIPTQNSPIEYTGEVNSCESILSDLYDCKISGCNYTSEFSQDYLFHVRSHYVSYTCDICLVHFIKYSGYVEHKADEHPNTQVKPKFAFLNNFVMRRRLRQIINILQKAFPSIEKINFDTFLQLDIDEVASNDWRLPRDNTTPHTIVIDSCTYDNQRSFVNPKQVARKSTTHVDLNRFPRYLIAEENSSRQLVDVGYSNYGRKPDTNFKGITTKTLFMGTSRTFSIDKLSELVQLFPVVQVEDYRKKQ